MSSSPEARAAAAFLIGFALVLLAAEDPLWALAGPEATLLGQVNAVRREHHLHTLRHSDALGRVALAHAQDMARSGYLSHVNASGQDPLDRVQAAGVTGFRLLAENIGASDVRGDRIPAVIEGWLGSPVHRENLLNPAFNQSGVGIAETPAGRTIVVQLYATFSEGAP